MKELKEALHENGSYYRNATMKTDVTLSVNDLEQKESVEENSDTGSGDYSKTNVQVDNVDEADIVKTDGNYIYYVTGNKVFIVDSKELKIISDIKIREDKKGFNPREIFINNDKLIVLGNFYEYEEVVNRNDYEEDMAEVENAKMAVYSDTARITSTNLAKAIVYDISNKELTTLAIATSIDALAIGISFAFLNVNIISSSLIIGIITFILCFIGVIAGRKVGGVFKDYAELIGGVILILIGINIFNEHTGFIMNLINSIF